MEQRLLLVAGTFTTGIQAMHVSDIFIAGLFCYLV